jgi:conjugal transfer pilus assembly protein TraV
MSVSGARFGIFSAAISSFLLAACANLTGLDGGSSYACKAPEGVRCDSVSGTYHNALQNNLPSQRRGPTSGQSQPPAAPGPAGVRNVPAMLDTATRTTPSDGASGYVAPPLRAAPRILRLWIKSWEDADRDLNGESLVYVQVDNGRWLVDHVQRQSREAFAPVRPGKSPAAARSVDAAKPPAGADDASSITQALRALQSRGPAATDN